MYSRVDYRPSPLLENTLHSLFGSQVLRSVSPRETQDTRRVDVSCRREEGQAFLPLSRQRRPNELVVETNVTKRPSPLPPHKARSRHHLVRTAARSRRHLLAVPSAARSRHRLLSVLSNAISHSRQQFVDVGKLAFTPVCSLSTPLLVGS
jgi:hypothetical protein